MPDGPRDDLAYAAARWAWRPNRDNAVELKNAAARMMIAGGAGEWLAILASADAGKEVLVTLPEGKTLKHGRLFCTSVNAAITCGQSQTKASFTLSHSGVKLSSAK